MKKIHSQNSINILVSLVIVAGLSISAYVFYKGVQIAESTESLLTDSLPNLELLKSYENLSLEEERIYYEYYANENDSLVRFNLVSVQEQLQSLSNRINTLYRQSESFALIDQAHGFITETGESFIANLQSSQTDWDLAREQLDIISATRRDIKAALAHQISNHTTTIEQNQEQTLTSLIRIEVFAVFYGLFTLIVTLVAGRMIRAYLQEIGLRQRLSLFPQRNPNPVISINEKRQMLFMNPASHKLVGNDKQINDDISDHLPANIDDYMRQTQSDSHHVEFDYEIGDTTYECQMHWLPDQLEWDLHLKDISAEKTAEKQLTYQAYHNPDSSLPNIYALEQDIDGLIEKNAMFALGILEIRGYASMFAVFGAQAANQIVNELASTLTEINTSGTLPSFDIYHIAESQFVLVSTRCVNADEVQFLANGVSARIDRIAFSCEHRLKLNFGFAQFPHDGQDFQTLFTNTRMTLDLAVKDANHQALLYSSEFKQQIEKEQTLLADLQRAVEMGEFTLNFQPQLDINQNKVVGAEVLIRWKNGDNWVSPADFIPLAETSGLIVNLGTWVLRESCQYARHLIDMGHKDIVIAVNISPRQFIHKGFYETVVDALERANLPAKNLELEITEGVLVNDEMATIASLNELKQLGVSLSIDDFGTGYSSLSYLSRFNIDKLKIDQSFIRNMLESERDEAIVKTIIELGKNLGVVLIAEGVEEQTHLDKLRDYHCEEIQGYFFSRPIPFPDLCEFLRDRERQS